MSRPYGPDLSTARSPFARAMDAAWTRRLSGVRPTPEVSLSNTTPRPFARACRTAERRAKPRFAGTFCFRRSRSCCPFAARDRVLCANADNEKILFCRANRETGATGLEPATSGVTGRRSNQLNYAPEEGRL